MTVTKDDFEKVWASQSPLTPYSFSDSQYKEGWNFVGSAPPSRQMWDAFMQNADEKLKYLYQHEDVPLGHEYFTFNPNIPQGSLPLFGGEYDRATYSDLWNWVQQQTGYLKTEAEWQTLSASNNGNVPYYSDGDGSTTFRVPSLKCWVRGANGTVSEVGSYLQAGLPNITGTFKVSGGTGGIDGLEGAFYSYSGGLQNPDYNSGTAGNIAGFDASLSSSVYGNSNTVQPESIVGMWLVKAYGIIVDTGQIDEQQYIDDRMADLKNVYLPVNYVPFSRVQIFQQTISHTYSTSSWEQIYSITIPAHCIYSVHFINYYNSAKPTGAVITLETGTNAVNSNVAISENQSTWNSIANYSEFTYDVSRTLYFYGRQASAGAGSAKVSYWLIPLE